MTSAEVVPTVPGAQPQPPLPRDIAIVGMACVMPGAGDLEAFWANVVDGVDSVTEVSPARWNPDIHFDPSYESSKRRAGESPMSVSKWGGFVPDVGFDALEWGIPPASLASIDPAQLLALKAAGGALVDAGYGEGQRPFDRDRASVVYATGSGGAADIQAGVMLRMLLRCHHVLDPLPPELDAFLPELTEDGLPGALTSLISGRVANRLDFGGKNLTVDSACASVLVALEICCDDLALGHSDLVLCGGVDLHNGAGDYVSFTAAQALSRRGRCYAFDADADGMTLAEGAGCIALKRLADAERDGDRIYAVIRGVAGSSDGRHLGLTAPRQEGQEKAVRRAYARAGLSPADVRLVEAHGTGTPVGDRIELRTTTQIFTEAGATPGSVVLGTVKSNIGHIKCAAGIAALIKAAKSAYHGVLPPTLHISQPNEVWDPETSPFRFLDQAQPWLDERRLVGVSSFGFGGTNFHAILENHRPADPSSPAAPVVSGRAHWPAELVVFRAASDADLAARLSALAARLESELAGPRQADRFRLRDLVASVHAAGDGPVRLAVVARDLDDLAAKLAAARAGTPADGVHVAGAHGVLAPEDASGAASSGARSDDGPAMAFLFPGPDAARTNMAADVLVALPGLRAAVAQAGEPVVRAMLPPQAFGGEAGAQRAALDEVAGPAVALASLTLARALAAVGVTPTHLASAGSPLLPTPAVTEALRAALGGAAPAPVAAAGEAELEDEVRRLHREGVRIFVEVGPGDGLTGRVHVALGDEPHLAVSVDRPGTHGLTSLLDALAQLAVAGVPVDVDALHAGRGSDPARWDDPPRKPGWIVNGHCARTAAGDSLPKGLNPAYDAPPIHLGEGQVAVAAASSGVNGNGSGNGNGHGPASADGQAAKDMAVVLEYLRIIQGMISTGSEIVRGSVGPDGSAGSIGSVGPGGSVGSAGSVGSDARAVGQ